MPGVGAEIVGVHGAFGDAGRVAVGVVYLDGHCCDAVCQLGGSARSAGGVSMMGSFSAVFCGAGGAGGVSVSSSLSSSAGCIRLWCRRPRRSRARVFRVLRPIEFFPSRWLRHFFAWIGEHGPRGGSRRLTHAVVEHVVSGVAAVGVILRVHTPGASEVERYAPVAKQRVGDGAEGDKEMWGSFGDGPCAVIAAQRWRRAGAPRAFSGLWYGCQRPSN